MSAEDRAWLVHSSEGSCGPYTVDEMRSYREQGILNDDSYVWKEGLPEWLRFADASELAAVPAPPPPPPPPPPGAAIPGYTPAPKIGPLQAAAVPERIRTLGAPVEEVPAVEAEPEPPFAVRQLQLALAGITLALLVVVIGMVPRPWWDEPALALTLIGIEPETPEVTAAEPTNGERDKGPATE